MLRCLNGLVPHFFDAHVTGSITLDGVPVAQLPSRDLASRIGTVFQDPRSEFFTFDVASELAFCCENFAMPSEEIVRRVGEIASEVGITDLLGQVETHGALRGHGADPGRGALGLWAQL